MCSVEGRLRVGRDLRPTPLPLLDAKGAELGKLTCSVTALTALKEIEAESAGDAVSVALSQLRLHKPPKSGRRNSNVFVLVDVLGVSEARTSAKQPASDGTASLGFRQSFATVANGELHSAILRALKSDEKEDSEVQFVVMAVDASTKGQEKETEIGVARCSLEQVLQSGSDLAAKKLPIKDKKGLEIGQLTTSVSALAALRQIEPLVAKDPPITVEVVELRQPPRTASSTWVSVEMPGEPAVLTPRVAPANMMMSGGGSCRGR